MPDKKTLRKLSLEKRRNTDGEILKELSKDICAHILNSDRYKNYSLIYGYMAVRGEADISPVLKKALSDGKRVALPKCMDKCGKMSFFEIKSFDDLTKGPFGISEPKPSHLLEEDEDSLMLVPGVAFDIKSGRRIGYGAGYYDRYLKDHHPCVKMGVSYELTVFDIPDTDITDISMDMIVTEKMIYDCKNNN